MDGPGAMPATLFGIVGLVAVGIQNNHSMKAKVFDVVLHKLPPGKSPASFLEEQLNEFFKQHLKIQLVATHMNTLILPPERNAMRGSEAAEPTVIIFSTLFYTHEP